ncbi:MAG: Sec-independent protein translocase protein TatB [Elioraea tepidiphila]
MLDLAWTEIALILVVALIVIGPKDLPHAIKGIAEFIRKARRMAGEFQVHVDEMMRETKLDEVKRQIDEVRHGAYEMKRQFEEEIDKDRDIAKSFSDPFAEPVTPPPGPAATPAPAPVPATASAEPAAAPPPPPPAADEPPAFLPPGTKTRDTV